MTRVTKRYDTVFRAIKDSQNAGDIEAQRRHSLTAVEGFGLFNDMRLDRKMFCPCELAKGRRNCPGHLHYGHGPSGVLDHPICFKDKTTNRPAAMVAQPYAHQSYEKAIAKVEATFGLKGHVAPAQLCSEHVPGRCYWIVFTPPNCLVNWLPEQADPLGEFGVDSFEHGFQMFLKEREADKGLSDNIRLFVHECAWYYTTPSRPQQNPRSFDEWASALNWHGKDSVLARPLLQSIVWNSFVTWRAQRLRHTRVEKHKELIEMFG
jgi:hypothetical protein